ncbi:OmpA family protein [Nitrospira moscoviensis]|uniref:Peptidoglycan-associated lipoprotein n=1 Tax=Nitrospira moscoviensis TaxID=42253 RepID=A0A0K2GKF4_NITMO|nr:OmpA family protein [Nitrospira moscoviensis]ALA61112.1 putative Peptidoglycan-associated lipoprotein Pal (Modular protein) [Nitrospira moscoviensis]
MASRLIYLLAVGHLLVWSAACSQQALRADGDDWPVISGATMSDVPLRGIERIEPDALLAEVDPKLAARRMQETHELEEQVRSADLHDVFFAYDSSLLDDEGMLMLSADAKWLLRHGNAKLRIEGHCDERGSSAYNFVLGEKRALAVQHYLLELGVPEEQLTVLSYGEERPFCSGHTETCHQQNRRGHLVVTR